MIGLGAKYLTAAGFGRYRITAASLGSLDLLGMFSWLKAATKQAIMAAFGVDGTAVIAATNEYLNGIAASDKAKATALAAYINEDPMMVCSLGLEPQGVTMPIRYMNSDGSTHIDTLYKPNNNTRVIAELKRNATVASWDFIFGVGMYTVSHRLYPCYYQDKFSIFAGQLNTNTSVAVVNGRRYVVNISPTTSYIDGVLVQTGTSATASSVNLWIGAVNNNNSNNGVTKSGFGNFQIYESGEELKHFMPFIRNNQIGMLDILSNTFYTVTGNNSWYMDYNLPDGTPWTPPTP